MMTKSTISSLVNGVAADALNVNDRATQYGDGVFETILCSDSKLYYWHAHYQRLVLSAEKLNILPPDEQVLLNDIKQLLKYSAENLTGKKACTIKIILTRGLGERGYHYADDISTNRIVSFSAATENYSSLLSRALLVGNLFLCEQQISINESLAGLKHLNRLDNVLARNEWNGTPAENSFIDGVMLNADQHVIEGTMSNLFTVKGNQLFTPDLKRSGVNGIMRNVIMEIALEKNIKVNVVNLSLDELQNMDEVFISNSLIGIKSVTCLLTTTYARHDITTIIFDGLLNSMDKHAKNI